jgi:hypothetical protein
MPWESAIREDPVRVEIRAHGKITKDEMLDSMRPIVQAWQERRIDRVLIDTRDVEAQAGTLDLFEFGQRMKDFPLSQTARFALVVSPSGDQAMRFLETLTRNRGVETRTFGGVEEAVAWLKA